jgi:hypothetical protein
MAPTHAYIDGTDARLTAQPLAPLRTCIPPRPREGRAFRIVCALSMPALAALARRAVRFYIANPNG